MNIGSEGPAFYAEPIEVPQAEEAERETDDERELVPVRVHLGIEPGDLSEAAQEVLAAA